MNKNKVRKLSAVNVANEIKNLLETKPFLHIEFNLKEFQYWSGRKCGQEFLNKVSTCLHNLVPDFKVSVFTYQDSLLCVSCNRKSTQAVHILDEASLVEYTGVGSTFSLSYNSHVLDTAVSTSV